MAKEARIEILKGNDSGAQFKVTGVKVLFGRSSESDIVITDPSASRTHAELLKIGDKFLLKDLRSSNGVFLNGKKISESILVPGDMFTIGNHAYRYIEVEAEPSPQPEVMQPRMEGTIPGISMSSSGTGVNVPSLSSGGTANKKRFIIYGIVLGVLLIFFIILFSTGDSPSKDAEQTNANSNNANVNANQNAANENEEEVVYKRKIPDDEKELFDKANEYFFEGDREVRLKNYSRALEDFRKALAFYPQHAKAKIAANTTFEKIKEESLVQMNLGKRMFSQKRYDDAIRHFMEVMNLNVRQPDSELFKEAEKWENMSEKRKGETSE